MSAANDLASQLAGLSESELAQVAQFVEFLQWQNGKGKRIARERWSYDFIEHFAEADQSADRDPAGMEVQIGEATCGGENRLALWEHPPLSGAARVGFVAPIPAGERNLTLRFLVGIRDGAELPPDRFVAFRVLVNGWKMWSVVKNSHAWDEYQVQMPELSSSVARVEFITDGLGDHRWNWAVWGEPKLISDL